MCPVALFGDAERDDRFNQLKEVGAWPLSIAGRDEPRVGPIGLHFSPNLECGNRFGEYIGARTGSVAGPPDDLCLQGVAIGPAHRDGPLGSPHLDLRGGKRAGRADLDHPMEKRNREKDCAAAQLIDLAGDDCR